MGFHKQNFNCLSRGGRNILKIPKSLINVVGFKIIANSFFLNWNDKSRERECCLRSIILGQTISQPVVWKKLRECFTISSQPWKMQQGRLVGDVHHSGKLLPLAFSRLMTGITHTHTHTELKIVCTGNSLDSLVVKK